MLLDAVIITLMISGLFFFFGTSVGLVRMPDFYTRMHAASKGDTLSSIVLLAGLALYNLHDLNFDNILVSIKIMGIAVIIFISAPTTSHAIIDAGYGADVEPWSKETGETDKNITGSGGTS